MVRDVHARRPGTRGRVFPDQRRAWHPSRRPGRRRQQFCARASDVRACATRSRPCLHEAVRRTLFAAAGARCWRVVAARARRFTCGTGSTQPLAIGAEPADRRNPARPVADARSRTTSRTRPARASAPACRCTRQFTEADARMRAGEYAIQPGHVPRRPAARCSSAAPSCSTRSRSSRVGRSASCARRSPRSRHSSTRRRASQRRRQSCARSAMPAAHPGRTVLSRHVSVWQGHARHRHPAPGARPHAQGTRRGVGAAPGRTCRSRTPYEALILASIVERETGIADERAAHRRRVRRTPAARHAAADRSDRDLRPGRKIRRQPAPRRSRARYAVQYVHARRAAADTDRTARRRVVARGRAARCARRDSSSSRPGEGDGSHAFSKTLAEHEAAVKQYLVRYRQQNSARDAEDCVQGKFITFEGGEGVGKSTQIARAAALAAAARCRRRADARARRHAARRTVAQGAARARRRTDAAVVRTAADVRRARDSPREPDRTCHRARRVGAVRSLHRRDVRVPGRRPRRAGRATSMRSCASCIPAASRTSRCCSTRRSRSAWRARGSAMAPTDRIASRPSASNFSSGCGRPTCERAAARAGAHPRHRRQRQPRRRSQPRSRAQLQRGDLHGRRRAMSKDSRRRDGRRGR